MWRRGRVCFWVELTPPCFLLRRHDDLKEMLDSNKDSLKLEAMKRIVAMIARGKNASDLFPAVVKNVACKNIEVKKLVYVYLVRYAEEQQDLALLSISTFQRGLKDPNQLIRASALRVLSSIRVTIIVPIMMLAIKEAASDMSPYVRKTAAHAIPKLYRCTPLKRVALTPAVRRLARVVLQLVAGSVVMAFEEVCPERIDLIHKNYRKLCNLLIDVEEWGQVVIINMLTRYARTQFLNPNINEGGGGEKTFYGSDEDEDEDEEEKEKKPYVMDPDHRLLLRNTKPLLQSRNAAVVMAVAQLYFHLAPKAEVGVIAKALVRLLRSHSEVQYVVLQNVATMTIKRRGMFEPYLKSFYIRSTDPTQIKILKLEVLTNLANETNISTILREFQTYIKSMDKDFVAATIQAIGRCATNIGEVRDTCLNGLVQLLSNRDELVVAESVVVIKKLLQMQPEKHSDIIKHMAKLTDNIQVPMARASILWLIGEYCEHVPKIAPDVLRKMAKSFTNEEDIVKLQIINLAAKLYLTNSKQTKLLTQYVLNLAKYDQNYDIRDRARFIRQLIVPTEKSGALSKYAKKLFLALKPAPVLESPFKDRDHFQLGSLSHLLNAKAGGYQELPDWPEAAPDPSVRNVEVKESVRAVGTVTYRDTAALRALRGPRKTEGGEGCSLSSEEDERKRAPKSKQRKSESESESDDDEESESESSQSESEDSESEVEVKKKKKVRMKPDRRNPVAPLRTGSLPSSHARQQLPVQQPGDGPGGLVPVRLRPFPGGTSRPPPPLSPSALLGLTAVSLPSQTIAPSSALKNYELLHRITGEGLSVEYCFSRQPFSPDANMVAVQMQFTNSATADTKNLHIEDAKLQSGMRVKEFPEIELLPAGETATAVMGIDFCDSTQAANFQLCTHTRKFFVSIQPPVGELMRSVFLTENEFKKEQGEAGTGGAVETESLLSFFLLFQKVTAAANLSRVPCGSDRECRFAGRTVTSGSLVLVTVATGEDGSAQLTVNCEKMVIGTMLVKDILLALTQ
uniref:AP-3 complex subunit beta n=1 Tax=Salarias fasciatus TaxID=181472 RepID=A0A672JAC6_SALFA